MNLMTPRALLDDSLVWDNHGCMPLRPLDESFLPQLARYRAGGVNAVTINIGFGDQGVEEHVRMVAQFRRWLALNGEDYMLATSVEDIERARREGKLAVLFDIEGMNAIADQPSLVQLYYDLGVRWMLIAYNRNNPVGGGCQDEDQGLTAFGRTILDEMARVGMVACCSHTGERTALEVMDYSSRPVIFSHSNARAIHDHPRNVRDHVLKACAATGGVVGLNGIGLFLGKGGIDLVDALISHLDHIVGVVGIEHVGLGLDYVFDAAELEEFLSNPAIFPPELGYGPTLEMVPPEAMEEIVGGLDKLGYADDDIRAILGGNLMRVAKQVWRPAFGFSG